MASEKPEPKIGKRKSSPSSVSPERKISKRTAARHPLKKKNSRKEKTMAEENQMREGGASPGPGEDELQSSASHARQAAEGLRAAAGAVAQEYRGKAEEYWNDASDRVRSFQDDTEQYVRENPTKAVLTALGIGFVLGLIFRR
jgi:ElaB/YqjD/DUF883 family membrane-anchored ribosome-binding protein